MAFSWIRGLQTQRNWPHLTIALSAEDALRPAKLTSPANRRSAISGSIKPSWKSRITSKLQFSNPTAWEKLFLLLSFDSSLEALWEARSQSRPRLPGFRQIQHAWIKMLPSFALGTFRSQTPNQAIRLYSVSCVGQGDVASVSDTC